MNQVAKPIDDQEDDIEELDDNDTDGESNENDSEDEGSTQKKAPDADDSSDEEADGESSENKQKKGAPSKNAERRMRRQEAERQSKAIIDSLIRRNLELEGRVNQVEKRSVTSEVFHVDNQLAKAQDDLNEIKRFIAEAAEANDGARLVKGQDALYEARKHVDNLSAMKQQILKANTNPQGKLPDPRVVQQGQAWMARHPWYNHANPDEDSAVVQAIDRSMAKQGFDPSTPEYWSELDRRVAARVPHRFSRDNNSVASQNNISDNAQKRKLGNPTAGGSRNMGNQVGKNFSLSAERVEAMKGLGYEPGTPEWKKLAKVYAEYDKKNQ